MSVTINPGALERLAHSGEVREACRRVGEQVAENVRGLGITVGDTIPDGVTQRVELPVEVFDERNGLGVVVIITHPAGAAVQAKHGALTRAAAAVGLPVT